MARDSYDDAYSRPVRRLLVAVVVILLIALAILWRIDNPRVERMRAAIVDRVVPNMEWAMGPVTGVARIFEDFQSYARLFEQNQELRRELQQMRAWREAALQLEQENARLLDLNRVQLDPELTFVTGLVLADSGSPFRRSVLINVGARDGILDGWATMDGLGVVGRVAGVGERTARVLLLTDSNSRIPVTIQPSGQQALLMGDNSPDADPRFHRGARGREPRRPHRHVRRRRRCFPRAFWWGRSSPRPTGVCARGWRRISSGCSFSGDAQPPGHVAGRSRRPDRAALALPGGGRRRSRAGGGRSERGAPRQQQRGRAMSSATSSRHIWTYRAIFLFVCAVLILGRLLPLGLGESGLPGPDLLLALTFAWLLRQPAVVPLAQS
jgi:cell shape-determining protein MreC